MEKKDVLEESDGTVKSRFVSQDEVWKDEAKMARIFGGASGRFRP